MWFINVLILQANILSVEYENGVFEFIEFSKIKLLDNIIVLVFYAGIRKKYGNEEYSIIYVVVGSV